MSVTPSQIDIVTASLEANRGDLHTCMPGEVVAVHAGAHKRQFVDVLPSLQRRVADESGELVDEQLPIIPMVPLAYMQGGGFYISVPIAVGDIVLLVFAERSLDSWIETARKNSKRAVIPGDVGTHTLDGAIALPCGPAPRGELLPEIDASHVVIGYGTAATDFVALAAKVDAAINTLKTAIGAGFTAVGVGPAANGPAGKSAFDTAAETIASVASSKTKVA